MNLNQITVPVTNLDKSITFYEKLGLRLIVKSPDYARFECPEGDSTFSLHSVDKPTVADGIWIYFEVKDPDAYVLLLLEKGITFDEMPTDKPWLWREARLKDPDGNQLIIYHAGNNRKNPPWRI
jgi:catechol 2,3-dioxygenase-like lactoylglutathione lyase family enzyme